MIPVLYFEESHRSTLRASFVFSLYLYIVSHSLLGELVLKCSQVFRRKDIFSLNSCPLIYLIMKYIDAHFYSLTISVIYERFELLIVINVTVKPKMCFRF